MSRTACPLLSLVLSLLLAYPSSLVGQEPQSLKIDVLAGEGAINNIEKRVVTEPVVEVRDEQGRPLSGVEVVFTAPPTGPSVTFFGASRTVTVTTDESGRARAGGMTPNTEEGTFPIEVTATLGSQRTVTTITQTNSIVPDLPKQKGKIFGWRLISAIGAAVAIGVTAAILRDGDEATATPTTVSVGTTSVGAPR